MTEVPARWAWWLLLSLSAIIAAYAVIAYGTRPLHSQVHPDMVAVYRSFPAGIYLHIFPSAIALLLGPLQFSASLRARSPAGHRWCGRAYLGLGVLPGGVAGLFMAGHAFGGIVSQTGFGLLALLWLGTGWAAWRAIWRGDVQRHRRWMTINFSLTFAAVTLRIYLGLFAASGMSFESYYPSLAWISWVPNLLFAEWWLLRRRRL